MSESSLFIDKHVLLCIDGQINTHLARELEYIKANFCGKVVSNISSFHHHEIQPGAIIYMCGDIDTNYSEMKTSNEILIIAELSYNYQDKTNLVLLGEIPINIYNAGVYFRNLFDCDDDYFGLITGEHKFQSLTESNKSGKAFRTGIYLTSVQHENDETTFRLLRCSSNLDGPTDNFRTIDNEIVNRVNNAAKLFFHESADLNHVLAQVYENQTQTVDKSKVEKKAKIKEHSDKTKDMPKNGLIAFCTFYKDYKRKFANLSKDIKVSDKTKFDYCYNNVSILTRLRFRLKNSDAYPDLQKQFDVTLYPNSVFIISLLTNRLYTHEIMPSVLSIDKIPIRLGYVIRCSKTEAIFKDGKTYLKDGDKCEELIAPDEAGVKLLKEIYRQENLSDQPVTYEKFHFSLNNGDYQHPIL